MVKFFKLILTSKPDTNCLYFFEEKIFLEDKRNEKNYILVVPLT